MKNLLYVVIGLVAIAGAIWQFTAFVGQPKNTASYMPIVFAVACGIVALVCGALFMSGRVNQTEDIHITE